MNVVKTTMEDVGLSWNRKRCAVVHARREVRVSDNSGMILNETARNTKPRGWEAVQVSRGPWEFYTGGYTGPGVRSQGVPLTDVCHLDKSFVRPQSCDPFKHFCLVGAWLSHMDATTANNSYTRDGLESWEDCYWERGKAPLWLKCDNLPLRDNGGRSLRSVEMEYIKPQRLGMRLHSIVMMARPYKWCGSLKSEQGKRDWGLWLKTRLGSRRSKVSSLISSIQKQTRRNYESVK